METDAAPAPDAAAVAGANGGPPPAPELSPEMCDKLTKLRDILSGKTPIALNLEFLYMHNKADLQVWAVLAATAALQHYRTAAAFAGIASSQATSYCEWVWFFTKLRMCNAWSEACDG